jgi:hypothetical protein
MTRVSRIIAALLALVGVLAAAPLSADDGHCARPVVAVTAHAHGPAHVVAAAPANAVSTEHGCPACPARSCGAMHGCSAAPQVSPEVVTVKSTVPAVGRVAQPDAQAVPASVTHSPPTPPPLSVLSLA